MGLLGIRLTPFNARLRRARRQASLTQKQLADLIGVRQQTYGAIERLCSSISEERATQIALVLGYDVEYLFPPETRNIKSVGTRSVEFVMEMVPLSEAEHLYLPSPEEGFIDKEMRQVLSGLLGELSPREERIIRLRFGLDGKGSMTLEEVGQIFGVTRDRIRQIETRALARLRHPRRAKELHQYLARRRTL